MRISEVLNPHQWSSANNAILQIDDTLTFSKVYKKKVIYKISAQYVKACRREVRKTMYFWYSKFQKEHNSYKNW